MLREFYRKEEGSGFLTSIKMLFIIFFVIWISTEIWSVRRVIRNVSDALYSSITSIATQNYNEIYDGVKSGEFSDLTFNEKTEDFDVLYDFSDIEFEMSKQLNLTSNCKENLYCLSNYQVEIKNPIINDGKDAKLKTVAKVDVTYYWSGVAKIRIPFHITIQKEAIYVSRY